MMRSVKKALACVLSSVLLIMLQIPALAAEAEQEPYTYQVTISAGAQGVFNENSLAAIGVTGDNVSGVSKEINESHTLITISGLHYGDKVSCDMANQAENNPVTLLETRYYNKGIRQSGHDNEEAKNASFTVEGDASYVVAYGIAGNMAEYRVRYVSSVTGEPLAEEQVYYGVIGDKPVVPYLYVEGYLPQAYNLTKTLSDNVGENVFEFDYTPVPESVIETVVNTVYVEGSEGQTSESVPAPAEETSETSAAPAGESSEAQQEDQEVSRPQEIIDLDDNPVPLGSGESQADANEDEEPSGSTYQKMLYVLAGGAAAVLVVVILIAVILKKRKERR
ncbi:MAG: hypothetical protein HFE64_05440 [Lachnospiraceae bacterium]|jgi:hypothetical protein|nr:hypothetical protein [Lachnospiraceae bacterium]